MAATDSVRTRFSEGTNQLKRCHILVIGFQLASIGGGGFLADQHVGTAGAAGLMRQVELFQVDLVMQVASTFAGERQF